MEPIQTRSSSTGAAAPIQLAQARPAVAVQSDQPDIVEPRRAPSLLPNIAPVLTLAEPGQGPHVGHSGHAGHGEAPRTSNAETVPSAPVPEVEPMRTIELGDGARFQLDMHPVRRTIAGEELSGISYGGSIPGPIFRVQQGSTVNVALRNRTDRETTLHPHGLRLDWRYDGVPHIGQRPVPPGGEFTSKLTFPDSGVYWYHPHMRDWAVRDQGAYGVFVVRPSDPAYYSPVNREEVLALDDILLRDPSARDGGNGPTTHVFSGMYGDTMLVNGRTDYALRVKQGEVVRFHVLNAADARVFNLAFPGARMKVIGSDIGKNEREEWADSVMISPAERYTVEVLFDKPGSHDIVSSTPRGTRVLGKVEVDSTPVTESHRDAFDTLRENADVKADIDKYRRHFDRPADKRLAIEVEMVSPPSASPPEAPAGLAAAAAPRSLWQARDTILWEDPSRVVNGRSNPANTIWKLVDPDTGAVNMDIQWRFFQGDVTKVEIRGGPMQHPIHFHGQRFLVLSVNGEKNPNLQWKDTVLVPAGQNVEILVDNSNPGPWMFHCHIGRHAVDQPDHRMTGFFNVMPSLASPPPVTDPY